MTDPRYIRTGGDREMFRVTLHERTNESWFEADVDEVVAWETDGSPAEFEPYMNVIIKWDSCAHVRFGRPAPSGYDGYLHLCGVLDFRKHVALMRELYALAFEVMGREPEPDEMWDDEGA